MRHRRHRRAPHAAAAPRRERERAVGRRLLQSQPFRRQANRVGTYLALYFNRRHGDRLGADAAAHLGNLHALHARLLHVHAPRHRPDAAGADAHTSAAVLARCGRCPPLRILLFFVATRPPSPSVRPLASGLRAAGPTGSSVATFPWGRTPSDVIIPNAV
eukprot:6181472-Pleurochrysis_carterae.AAC.2